jgi:release factor glutamine methyltransferase
LTVGQWFSYALAQGVARADARALLCHALQVTPAWCIAHTPDEIPPAKLEALFSLLLRRNAGEPVAYLVGFKEFFGRRFVVDQHVLVPRPETELLIETALALFDNGNDEIRVLDLGTGSGCIGLSLLAERPRWRATCADESAAALAVAQKNAQALGVATRVDWVESNWLENLATTPMFDLVVSNPPYIAPDDHHLQGDGVRFEPRRALTDEDDGLAAYRVFARDAPSHLRAHGWLLVEHGATQAGAVRELFAQSQGWRPCTTAKDLAGLERVTMAQRADH